MLYNKREKYAMPYRRLRFHSALEAGLLEPPMETDVRRESVIGQPLNGIAHSPYSEPEFVLEAIGPARFRSHFLFLANGIVLDLSTAELLLAQLPRNAMTGETVGLDVSHVLGRQIAAVALDDEHSVLVILEGGCFLKDGNDGCYGNPLFVGQLDESYPEDALRTFLDYWTERPLASAGWWVLR